MFCFYYQLSENVLLIYSSSRNNTFTNNLNVFLMMILKYISKTDVWLSIFLSLGFYRVELEINTLFNQ